MSLYQLSVQSKSQNVLQFDSALMLDMFTISIIHLVMDH